MSMSMSMSMPISKSRLPRIRVHRCTDCLHRMWEGASSRLTGMDGNGREWTAKDGEGGAAAATAAVTIKNPRTDAGANGAYV
ncbi:hypothetical protein M5D96_004312 [Drosophila gunungcola]|uniref:Uncharacterized protein n=1 Tax=Drosophila gunungcola TaxID=103775 RepID=A0A9P9YU90_9MUSC|nr:hypothetical protein M5D96_004312 [Drosophila gunungcola]